MAKNNLTTLTQANTVTVGTNMSAAFSAQPATYNLDEDQAEEFAASLAEYKESIDAFNQAEAAYRAAAQDKLAKKKAFSEKMSRYAKIAYAAPDITAADLAGACLAVYDKPGKVTLKPPTALQATPFANGIVKLNWNRGGNASSVAFIIEESDDLREWRMVAFTGATKFTLQGYTPGVRKWFRVLSTARGITSSPSSTIPIYEAGPVALGRAAA